MEYTIKQIFNQFGNKYLEKYNPTYEQKGAFSKIIKCRTEELGTRIYECKECGKKVFSYNSCNDRHCPNCQNYRKEVWINNHLDDVLNTNYFHVVLTVPTELHPIFYHNQEKMYNILFQCASETILELCSNKKYLGAKVGITAMLHTWSQKMNYHPHIHMIVTGGGINKLGKWISAKEDYLLPIQAISNKFQKKLLDKIAETNLHFYNGYIYLNNKNNLEKYLLPLYKKDFICYSKPPFKNVNETYEYLGRYAFKVCLSNEKIKNIDNTYVYFEYKDYKDRSNKKIMKIKGEEFIRKFLLHILPKSFMKIRYYGILTNKGKKERLVKIKILTNTTKVKEKLKTKLEIINKMMNRDITKCKYCNGYLELISITLKHKPPNIKDCSTYV